jgi:hypothetical protein
MMQGLAATFCLFSAIGLFGMCEKSIQNKVNAAGYCQLGKQWTLSRVGIARFDWSNIRMHLFST